MRTSLTPCTTCGVLLLLRGCTRTARGLHSASSLPGMTRQGGGIRWEDRQTIALKNCRNSCIQTHRVNTMAPCEGTATGSESDTKRSLEPPQGQHCADEFGTQEEVLFSRPGSHEGGSASRWNIENKRRPVGDSVTLPSSANLTTSTSTPEAVLGTSLTVLGREAERMDEISNGREAEREGGRDQGEDLFAEELMSSVVDGLRGAAEGVTPVSRRADGRFQIDGNGLLNLCILVTAGLWAAHTVFTVDATISRGWTLQETLMRIPWDNWDSYETGLAEHPIITKTAINVVIYLLGDWLSQVNWGRDEDRPLWEFDLKRTLRNGLIAAFFGPLVHYYYDFSDSVLPPDVPINRPFKIVMDQTIFFITKCTAYISLVSFLRGDPPDKVKESVLQKVPAVVTTGWRFWPFVHVVTYFMVPPRHRVLWVNSVDLLWSSVLAGMASGTSNPESLQADGHHPKPDNEVDPTFPKS